jgi:hypothetical protein
MYHVVVCLPNNLEMMKRSSHYIMYLLVYQTILLHQSRIEAITILMIPMKFLKLPLQRSWAMSKVSVLLHKDTRSPTHQANCMVLKLHHTPQNHRHCICKCTLQTKMKIVYAINASSALKKDFQTVRLSHVHITFPACNEFLKLKVKLQTNLSTMFNICLAINQQTDNFVTTLETSQCQSCVSICLNLLTKC